MLKDTFSFDGLHVPVEIWGSGPEALVFLPGLGVHPSYYGDGIARLAERSRVVLPDLSFKTHGSLFQDVAAYAEFAEELADRYAPEAPRVGHSFGGLVAMLGNRPAIACAPSVPVKRRWITVVGRAVRLQLEEYTGGEGWPGARFAARIMVDYVSAAIRKPRVLFPTVTDTLAGVKSGLHPVCPRAHVILSRADALYRTEEYQLYLDHLPDDRLTVTTLDAGHDWPVTRPELLARMVMEAARLLRQEAPFASGAAATVGPAPSDGERTTR